MTYEKAIQTLIQYKQWILSEGSSGCKRPTKKNIIDAFDLSVKTMQKIYRGELPTSPEKLRFDVLEECISAFIQGKNNFTNTL